MIALRTSDAGAGGPSVHVAAARPRVLFVCRAIAHFIYHETVIVALLRRGAEVKVLFDEGWSSKKSIAFQDDALNAFRLRYPQVRIGWSVRRTDRWRPWIFAAREIRSYASYLRRGARTTEFYVERWLGYVPQWVRGRHGSAWFRRLLAAPASDAALRLLERVTPPDAGVVAHLRAEAPDVVLVSPANMRFSEEVEYLKAAKSLSIPVALHTMTWDNLSTKGVHHVVPDLVFLWNEIHFDDIREFHGFPESVCCIAGSPFLERWFDDAEPEGRGSLCRRMGVEPARPYVIYLGSSRNIARDEAWVVERLHDRLRRSADPRLRGMSIVIRPHPANVEVFRRLALDGVVIWPRGGALPQTADLHHEFRSMLAHATASIGINTTAMSDALLADCPCLTPLLREYDRTQRNANHFRVLAERDVMVVCDDWRSVESSLTDLLDGIDATRQRRRGFKAWFARPRGIDRSAGDVMAERIFAMVKSDLPTGRAVPAVGAAAGAAGRIAERISQARAGTAFRNYLDARDIVCAMLDEAGDAGAAVSPWMDAGALTIDELRAALGRRAGDSPEAYAVGNAGHETAVRRLHAALAGLDDRHLWSGEPDGLGQYGYPSDAGRLNLTGAAVRYALLALSQCGCLEPFLAGEKRTLAVIGAGWGGLALAFASRFPNATVVVLDEPEGLMLAATWLRSVAPRLALATVTGSSIDAVLPRLAELDVVLVPLHLMDRLDVPALDGTLLDGVSGGLGHATAAATLARLAASGCPRSCVVMPGAESWPRLAEVAGIEPGPVRHLIDWPAWSAQLQRSGGDPTALAGFDRMAHMLVRR